MTNPLRTPKRLKDGKTEWLCPICGWVSGRLWNGTGYTDLICEGCSTTLEPDYYGFADIENSQPDPTEEFRRAKGEFAGQVEGAVSGCQK
jgi:hypothetical protein